MFLFQAILLSFLTLITDFLQSIDKPETIAFWLVSLLSFCFYCYASQTCPGYVTQNDVNLIFTAKGNHFSDERSVSFSVEVPEINPKGNAATSFHKFNEEVVSEAPPQTLVIAKNHESVNTNRSEDDDEEEKEPTQNQVDNRQIEDIQIMEIRHCTICRIDQPMRTKHCRDCGKCIATHDHHCPWLGICIGEKNKKIFYWYLALQLIQLVWAIIWVFFI